MYKSYLKFGSTFILKTKLYRYNIMKIKYILSVGYIIHVTNDLNNDSKSIHNRFVSMVGLKKSPNTFISSCAL